MQLRESKQKAKTSRHKNTKIKDNTSHFPLLPCYYVEKHMSIYICYFIILFSGQLLYWGGKAK